LYLIYSIDFSEGVSSTILGYADDNKILRVIKSSEDHHILQNDINKIFKWTLKNKIPLNIEKCSVITYSSSKKFSAFAYTIDNLEIARCSSIKDLGVIYQNNFRFDLQLNNVLNNASRSLGLIKRFCRNISDVDLIRTLYLTYVRSKLTSAIIIWAPQSKDGFKKLEKIQKKFIKFLCYKMNIIYHRNLYIPILNLLDHPSINKLIDITLVKFLYRILNNKINSVFLTGSINFNAPVVALRRHMFFKTTNYKAIYLERNVLNSAMKIFNKIIKNSQYKCLDFNYHHWSAFYHALCFNTEQN